MTLSTLIVTLLSLGLVAGLVVLGWRWRLTSQLYWRRAFIVACLLAIGVSAGFLPLKRLDPSELTTNSDVIFLVDTTYSMNALDGRDGDTRLLDVQHDLQAFAQQLNGSRVGIITYDRSAAIYLPLTTTYSDITTAAETLSTTLFYSATSDPSLTGALGTTKSYLEKLEQTDATRHRVLVVMTDGELTGATDSADSVNAAARDVAPLLDASVVIGYGSNEGANMPIIRADYASTGGIIREDNTARAYQNNRYAEIISKRDENQLRALAQNLGGTYVPSQDKNQAATAVVDARSTAADKQAASPESRALRQNILHVPVAVLIIAWLFVTEIWGWAKVREFVASWRRT